MEKESWQPATPPVSAASFPKIIADNPVVVFHVRAVWNRHDRKMDAVLQELRPEFNGRIAFYAINADDSELWDIMRSCKVENITALIFFVNGARHETVIGGRPKAEMQARLNKLLVDSAAE